MKKRNEQVTLFIETVFRVYYDKQTKAGCGRPKYLSLWSDNCGDQFKNRYQFGWGSMFLRKFGLWGMFFNFFAPGHGKGICDSEGGISKHAVANAALHGAKLSSPYDLYVWLRENAVEVTSKTVNALHSPDIREYHYFGENEFLEYHPIDVYIDRINCYHSFSISRSTPLRLYSRHTTCFCEACKLGNFSNCIDSQFHGEYHINDLDITLVEQIPDHIDLGIQMRARLLDLRASYTKPFVVMLYERQNIWRPTFALISPGQILT
jgi:hypothetical protein